MKKVNELYKDQRLVNEDIYVIGTGPSLRLFPISFLNNKFSIGLNNSYKFVKSQIIVTIHPDLHYPFDEEVDSIWISKYDKCKKTLTDEQFRCIENKFYFYSNDGKPNTAPANEPTNEGRILEWLDNPTEDKLYQWSSISQTAINLAVNLGAKNIFLVGCDGGPILGNDHVDNQHTRWKGVDPDHRYRQYREGIAEIRNRLIRRDVNVMSLSPFSSLVDIHEEFTNLCKIKNVSHLIESKEDISPNQQKSLIYTLINKLFK